MAAEPQSANITASEEEVDNSYVPDPVAKRIVICCDGTWQSSISGIKNVPSNVTRIARTIALAGKDRSGKVWQQVVHYDAGIGTGEITKSDKDRQGGFGIGFVGNVIEAYNFIVLNYSPGDQIFCFGFSRGAYTARAVAGLVNDIGVISPRDMQDFADLYSSYQHYKESQSFRKSQAYRDWIYGVKRQDGSGEYERPSHAPALESSRVVEVVGVFDTVGALGIPELTWMKGNLKFLEDVLGIPKAGFHNVKLSPYIKHAFHALALDEHRGPFSPTLWHMPSESQRSPGPSSKPRQQLADEFDALRSKETATENELNAAWSALIDCDMYEQLQGVDSNLLQVWFPGVHINVGGGNDGLLKEEVEGDLEQIALITYAWMIEHVAPYLTFYEDLTSLGYDTVTDRKNLIQPVLDRVARGEKDFGSGPISSKIRKALDATSIKPAELRKIAANAVNGWATGPIVDSFTGSMALAGSITRTPGQYNTDERGNKLGPTYEMFHPTVAYRMLKDQTYQPKALSKFKRHFNAETKRYEWQSKEHAITLPEFVIRPKDQVTRKVASHGVGSQYGNEAEQFIGAIDREVGQLSEERTMLEQFEADKRT